MASEMEVMDKDGRSFVCIPKDTKMPLSVEEIIDVAHQCGCTNVTTDDAGVMVTYNIEFPDGSLWVGEAEDLRIKVRSFNDKYAVKGKQ